MAINRYFTVNYKEVLLIQVVSEVYFLSAIKLMIQFALHSASISIKKRGRKCHLF